MVGSKVGHPALQQSHLPSVNLVIRTIINTSINLGIIRTSVNISINLVIMSIIINTLINLVITNIISTLRDWSPV